MMNVLIRVFKKLLFTKKFWNLSAVFVRTKSYQDQASINQKFRTLTKNHI